MLHEILKWSRSRPNWQRDALRRLVTSGDLDESDLKQLASLSKSDHGLAEPQESEPLLQEHVASSQTGADPVTLRSLIHHSGVNALASDQTLAFGRELTVIYGDNAAGKSGYTRILKRACRARGAENVLGNVLEERPPIKRPSATITFAVGSREGSVAWSDQPDPQHVLGQVSVFDMHCASVYLREKTDVAFRPFGLDLFDKLCDASEGIKRQLERELRELESQAPQIPKFSEGTSVAQVVSNISSLTSVERIRELGTLSEEEVRELAECRKQTTDLQAQDPQVTSKTLLL